MDFSIAPSVDISIHAPRTGSDLRTQSWGTRNQYFNPRSPHGERLPRKQAAERTTAFQSTLPARGATATFLPETRIWKFQSTLPARGATFINKE